MIAIVTDSTIYLTKEEAVTLGVRIVPIQYKINGVFYLETYTDHQQSFETLLANSKDCRTSQVPTTVFTNTFEELIQQGYDILCLVLSSRLGGTHSSATIAAKAFPNDRIAVVDSHTTVGALRLLAEKASDWIRAGYPLKEICSKLEVSKKKAGIVFSVSNMEALRQSGRVTLAKQSMSTILNNRPILIYEDGAISAYSMARGKQEQVRELVERVPLNASKVVLQSQHRTASVEAVYCEIKKRLPTAEILCSTIGPVISINIGLDAIVVSWICDDK